MQRGIATLEIILATFIIALLMSIAVPNAVKIVDRIALDYETKRLYSDLRFLQAISRSDTFDAVGTGRTDFDFVEAPYMQITPVKFSTQILRGNIPLREAHYMQNIKNISSPKNRISFDSDGKANINSDSIVLTSRLGKKSAIVFDSVGRIRGGRDEQN